MQKGSQTELKIELWAFRDLIFEILGGFARGLIFDAFLIGNRSGKIRKFETEVRKYAILDEILGGVGGRGGAARGLSIRVRTPCSPASRGRRI